MKRTKTKSIIFGIVSILIIFSIAFMLNSPKAKEYDQNDLTKRAVSGEKIEYTLGGLSEDILENIDQHRITSDLSREEMEKKFKKYLYSEYTSLEEGIKETVKDEKIGIAGEKNMFSAGSLFTHEEALEDINYLFTNLKYGYAGYEYFGGDKKFDEAKRKILKDVKEAEDQFQRIEALDFQRIIINNLKFIKDGHFKINYMALTDATYTFMNKDEIVKEKDIFYLIDKNKKYPILSIEGKNPKDYMRMSIDKDGKIIYKIVALKHIKNNSYSMNMTIKDQDKVQKKITMKKVLPATFLSENGPYSFEEIEGIPVFKVASFNVDLEKLAKDGLKYSDKEIAILDLRGNVGGSCKAGWEWLSNFTNNHVDKINVISAVLVTDLSKKRVLKGIPNEYEKDKKKEGIFELYEEETKSSELIGWGKIDTPQLERLKNDKVIIVLFDKNSVSASEGMISSLGAMDNVIFIGTNSAGALNITGTGSNILPNSKLRIDAGVYMAIEPDFVWRDGVGYLPDFWVEPDVALERTIKFVNNYIKK
ncbi:MAG: S41 family peptidase [Marinisporobacter sp.]|jgi:C-terminal processing protease CtpA/Prc|nr:S41 family peptidase [Marinisporobacter sp.]